MTRIEMPHEPLSDYERAVCYYTLPRISNTVTVGLIVVYAICVLEALGAVVYGLMWDNNDVAVVGSWALGGIVVFGVVAFMVRAIVAEVRQRRALAIAKNIPDAVSSIQDIPDPFGDHILLRHPLHQRGDLFPCTDNAGKLVYFVESAPESAWWKVKDPQDKEVLRVHVRGGAGSFSLGEGIPSRLSVLVGSEEVAQIHRKFSFTTSAIEVECNKPERKAYTIRNEGVYRDKRLVGRIYYLRKSLYLDIEEKELNDALLGLFVVMT